MKPLALGSPPGQSGAAKMDWAVQALRKVEQGSKELTAERIADNFDIANLVEVRTIDMDTATVEDMLSFIMTFIADLKSRGAKRTSA